MIPFSDLEKLFNFIKNSGYQIIYIYLGLLNIFLFGLGYFISFKKSQNEIVKFKQESIKLEFDNWDKFCDIDNDFNICFDSLINIFKKIEDLLYKQKSVERECKKLNVELKKLIKNLNIYLGFVSILYKDNRTVMLDIIDEIYKKLNSIENICSTMNDPKVISQTKIAINIVKDTQTLILVNFIKDNTKLEFKNVFILRRCKDTQKRFFLIFQKLNFI